jgi:hypothetical protein
MQRHWLTSALAALALTAAPVLADEQAPPGNTPPAPETPVAQSGSGQQAAPAAPAPEKPGEQEAPAAPAPPAEAKPAPAGTRVAQTPPAQPTPTGGAQTGQPGEKSEKKPEPPPPPRFTYGGSADFYFETNFNEPHTGKNVYRAFDIKDEHGPHLGLIDLWAQYARNPVGGRIDVDFGPTARLVNAFEPSHSDVWEHIQQVYVSANLDGKKGRTYVDLGKWVTPAGFEVIEPRDNWLYSRGLLFNLAIPFYHLGGRLYHYFNDTDYVMVAGHRGWNAVGDPGHSPGFILAGSKALNSKMTFTGNFLGGDEPGPTGSNDFRSLGDLILAYNPTAKTSYALNLDAAGQSGANWFGLGAHAKFSFTPKQYVAFRAEVMRDNGGLISGSTQTLASLSLGYTYLFNKYAQARLEARHDFGTKSTFPDEAAGSFSANQTTVLVSAILGY